MDEDNITNSINKHSPISKHRMLVLSMCLFVCVCSCEFACVCVCVWMWLWIERNEHCLFFSQRSTEQDSKRNLTMSGVTLCIICNTNKRKTVNANVFLSYEKRNPEWAWNTYVVHFGLSNSPSIGCQTVVAFHFDGFVFF